MSKPKIIDERGSADESGRQRLIAELQKGLDSGPPEPLDMEAIKAQARLGFRGTGTQNTTERSQ